MACAGAADLHQNLAGPGFGYRHLAQFGGSLPVDELKRFQVSTSWGRISSKSTKRCRGPRNTWRLPVGRRILDEPRVIHPAQERLERGIDFQPCERAAETGVNAAPPAHVLVVFTFRVELVRVGEAPRVAVGRAVHQEDGRALGNCRAGDLDVGQGRAAGEELHRGLQPQRFLNRTGNLIGPAAQQLDGPGVAQHGEHAVRDQVDRGVMTGDEQQDRVVHNLAGRHRPVGSVIVHQLRNHPGARGPLRRARPARSCIS